MSEDRHINFKLMRERILAQQSGQDTRSPGKSYWRSLEELADAPEFREFIAREFPLVQMLCSRHAKGLMSRFRLRKRIPDRWFLTEIHKTFAQSIIGIRAER